MHLMSEIRADFWRVNELSATQKQSTEGNCNSDDAYFLKGYVLVLEKFGMTHKIKHRCFVLHYTINHTH